MSFVSKAEFSGTISTTIIDVLTSNNDAIVNYLVDENVEFIKCYLRSKYSGETLFAATGDSRNRLLVKIVKDLSVYSLYGQNYIFRKIPAIREQRYVDALQWLRDVQDEKINPFFYTGATGNTIMIKAGSNDKRNNYQT